MKNAKIYSKRRGILVSLMYPVADKTEATNLPETERELCVQDLGVFGVVPWKQSRFDRPHPYAHGNYTDGHEKHEGEPSFDGSPDCFETLARVALFLRAELTTPW